MLLLIVLSSIADIAMPREELRAAWLQGEYAALFPEGQYRNQA